VKGFEHSVLGKLVAVSLNPSLSPLKLGLAHRRRLRDIWRSAGWPCQDLLEAELLASGWLERVRDAHGRDSLRVTDAGVEQLVHTLQHNRAARDEHEQLVARVAREMQRAGRIVWRGLSLRAPLVDGPVESADRRDGDAEVDGDEAMGCDPVVGRSGAAVQWVMAMPDVFSVRHTTVEAYLQPVVHEIKVRRSDLLSDLRQVRKRKAYLALGGECWYVLAAGVGGADDVPPDCGVMLAHRGPASVAAEPGAQAFGALEVLRPAPRRAVALSFGTWMSLARANAEPALDADEQGLL
jgi:hypothetical protein